MLELAAAFLLQFAAPTDGHALFLAKGHPVHARTPARDAAGILATLLAGPTAAERSAGITTAVPAGTRLLALHEDGDRITVDLSPEFGAASELALEQVVKSLESLRRYRAFAVRTPDAHGELQPFGDRPPHFSPPASSHPVPSPSAASGVLAGRTIAVSPGHGHYWHSSLGWTTQRPLIDGLVEDIHTNQIVIEWVIPYLEAAGAKIVHCREPGLIDRELLLDNDDGPPHYLETGSWTSSSGSGYLGKSYRFASGSSVETARATFTGTVPVAGDHPVWVLHRAGTNRSRDVHWFVEHSGGTAERVVDQSADDLRFVLLGVFHFSPAAPAKVHLSNRTTDSGKVVIADAVRIGAGLGSIVRGAGPSGKPRWQECSRYHAQYDGAPATVWDSISGGNDNDDDVTCRPRYAEWRGADAYLSLHTNAGGGSGTSSYIHDSSPTPGSVALQAAIHGQIIQDLRAGYDPAWIDRGRLSANFGEVRLLATMPGTLIELAFHDDQLLKDHRYLHDPRFRQLSGRAIARGVIRYFNPSTVFPPEPPDQLRVTQDGNAGLLVAFAAVPGATGYVVEQSPDGYGFDEGTLTGGTSWSTGPLPHGTRRGFRVRAVNASGRSLPTEVLVGRTGPVGRADVLLVQGFDRFDRYVKEPENRRDYLARHADAILRIVDTSVAFDATTNEAAVAGRVRLSDYRAVAWALGEESTADETFSAAEQSLVAMYLAAGGRLFVSGAELGWDLDLRGSAPDRAFYRGPLAAAFVADDAGVRRAGPAAGSIFAGLADFDFDDGTRGTYDVDYPDAIAPSGANAKASLAYRGAAYVAAIERDDGTSRVLNWGMPFETITDATLRGQYMDRALAFLLTPRALEGDRAVDLGGRANLSLTLPGRAGQVWVLAASGSTQPGFALGAGRILPLAADPLFAVSLAAVSGTFAGFFGVLDGSGRGAASVNIPNLPELRGVAFFVSGLTLHAQTFLPDEVLPWVRITVR